MPSSDLQPERRRLRARIEAAFKGVARDGGVSWSEAPVIDGYGFEEDQRKARASDRDLDWPDLLNDPPFQIDHSFGGFSFLDAIGFRYYLPAAMIQCLDEAEECRYGNLMHTLELPVLGGRSTTLQQWRLLTERQQKCVAAFLRFMAAWDARHFQYDHGWQSALKSYWDRFPETE